MRLTVDSDLTEHYAPGWKITLTLSPTDGTAHLAWAPEDLGDPQTFVIRLTSHPLTKREIRNLKRAYAAFEDLDVIADAPWVYLHNQNRWGWAEGDWWDAVDALHDRLDVAA